MDELKNAIKEIVEQEIIKVVISNKKNRFFVNWCW